MTKCYVQKKDVFDIDKVTVVGEPTITADGIASGFAVGSYVNVPVLNLSSGDFEVETTFNFVPAGRTQVIYRCATDNYAGTFGFLIAATTNNKFYLSGTVEDVITNIILTQATYNAKLKVKNQIAYVYLNGDLVIEAPFTKSITSGYLSFGYGVAASLFAGSIDLPSIKIYTNNELIYSPTKPIYFLERRKEGFDRSKFTVVGTPTITEDGIFEKISTSTANLSDYVTMPFDNTTSYFRLEFNFYFGSGAARLIGDSSISCFQIYVSNWGMNGTIYNSTDGNVSIPAPVNSSTAIQIGNYNVFIEYKDNVYTIGYKREEETSFKTSSTTSATKGTKNLLSVLKQTDANTNFKVDLKSITIFSNGKEVFTGAKEKFYAMRGGK